MKHLYVVMQRVVETMKEIVLYEATFVDCLTEDEKEYLEER